MSSNEGVLFEIVTAAAMQSLDVVTLEFPVSNNPMLEGKIDEHSRMVARLPYVVFAAGWKHGCTLRLGFLVPAEHRDEAYVRSLLERYACRHCGLSGASATDSDDFRVDQLATNPSALPMPIPDQPGIRRSSPKRTEICERPVPVGLRRHPAPLPKVSSEN